MNELEEELLPQNFRDKDKRPESPRRVHREQAGRVMSARIVKAKPTHMVRIHSDRNQTTATNSTGLRRIKSTSDNQEIRIMHNTAPVQDNNVSDTNNNTEAPLSDRERISSFIQKHKELGHVARLICKKKRESRSIFRMTRAVITDSRASSVFKQDKPWPKLSNKLLITETK